MLCGCVDVRMVWGPHGADEEFSTVRVVLQLFEFDISLSV
jgi:hypothetical protein